MMYALLIPFRSLLAEIDVMRPIAAALWQLQPNLEWSRAMLCRLCSDNFTRKSVVFVEDEVRMSEQPRKMQVATLRLNVPEQYTLPQWFKTASPREVASALSMIPSLVPFLKGDLTQGLHIHQQISEAIASARQEAQKEKEIQLNRHEEALQKLVSSHTKQMSDMQAMMKTRVDELIKENRALKLQAENITIGEELDMPSITKAVKEAGYIMESEEEYLVVKRGSVACLISASGVTSHQQMASLADAAIFISGKIDAPCMEMRQDRHGRDHFPVACIPESPSEDLLLTVLAMIFDFLTISDSVTSCEGVTNEEQRVVQDHFLDLATHVKEMFQVFSEQRAHMAKLSASLTQATAKTMIWYRSAKRKSNSLVWSKAEMELPFESAYEHAIGRKWNDCTAAKADLLQESMGKEAVKEALKMEPEAAQGEKSDAKRAKKV